MTRFIIYFFIFTSFTTSNTYLNYYELINQATYATHQKEYEKSDSLFQKAVKLVETPFAKDYTFAVHNALELKDFTKAFAYLKTAIQLGLSKEKIKEKSWFRQIENRTEWFLLEQEYPALWKNYESQFDAELRQAILDIYNNDQDARSGNGKNIDVDNLELLKKIVAENGYPGYHKIGQDIDLDLVFHHFLPENNELFFYKILKEAVFTGDIMPFRYGAIVDYDAIKKGKGTVYGTYIMTIDGQRYLYPVENIDDVDERRKTIGLEPIEEYLQKNSLIYDPNFMGY